MVDKSHSVTVTITSRSNGSVNQEVAFTEYAACAELAAPYTSKGKK